MDLKLHLQLQYIYVLNKYSLMEEDRCQNPSFASSKLCCNSKSVIMILENKIVNHDILYKDESNLQVKILIKQIKI